MGVRRGPSNIAAALAEAVGRLVSRTTPRTIGVLSGDLSTLGNVADVGEACYWWNSCSGSDSIYVLGNHDFWNGQPLRTGARHSRVHKEIRAAHWPIDQTTTVIVGDMRISIHEIDTTPSEELTGLYMNVIASGELHPPIVADLKSRLDAQAPWDSGPDIRVLVMHHPVDRMRKSTAAIAQLRQAGSIELVLAGHTHKHAFATYGFRQATCGSSTLEHKGEPPCFLVHRLTSDGGSCDLHAALWQFDGSAFVAA